MEVTMKAKVVHKFGGPEVLTLEEVDTPKAAPSGGIQSY
jgi:NADPH:quinone reductase-like Zn-dependent oxidoreductase